MINQESLSLVPSDEQEDPIHKKNHSQDQKEDHVNQISDNNEKSLKILIDIENVEEFKSGENSQLEEIQIM